MKTIIAVTAAGLLSILQTGVARSQPTQVEIPSSRLSTHVRADSSASRFYLLSLDLPQTNTVREAWLELRLDVATTEVEGFHDPVPVFQVFMLRQTVSSEPDESSLEKLRLPMSRPVAVGQGRLVRIDVTEYVRRILAVPSSDYGLVLGSVVGDSGADFEIDTNAFGAGVPARLTIVE